MRNKRSSYVTEASPGSLRLFLFLHYESCIESHGCCEIRKHNVKFSFQTTNKTFIRRPPLVRRGADRMNLEAATANLVLVNALLVLSMCGFSRRN